MALGQWQSLFEWLHWAWHVLCHFFVEAHLLFSQTQKNENYENVTFDRLMGVNQEQSMCSARRPSSIRIMESSF